MDKEKFLTTTLKRFDDWSDAEFANRSKSLEDIRFINVDDAQWDERQKRLRKGRPCMQFDRTSGAANQVVGDNLQNRPGIKIRPMEDGDTDVAEIYTGLIRSIESTSNAKRAYKNGFKFAVHGGFGAWRVRHDYVDDDSFFQDLLIEPIPNPFSVLFDKNAQLASKQDGQGVFIFHDMPVDDFETEYPDAQSKAQDFEGMVGADWLDDDTIRVAEYYYKVPKKKTLYLLSTGEVVDEDAEPILDELEAGGVTVVNTRKVDGYDINYCKMTGVEVLEEIEYKGKYFPVVPVWGKTININGEFLYEGIVRKAKDPQRLFNYELNAHAEITSMQGRAPYMATPKMIENHKDQWQSINTSNDPVLMYDADPTVQGGRPTREAPPQPSSGVLAMLNIAADNIKATTNIHDASLGAQSNETSGRAILARDRQGDTATYEFLDEFSEALEMTGRILVDLIPKVYDAPRQLRIVGEDGTEDSVEINKTVVDLQTLEPITFNDLSKGKYDVQVTTGPSYSTKRVETMENLGQIIAQNPQMAAVLGDLWVKNSDFVGSDEVMKRLRRMGIQQGLIDPDPEDEEEQKMIAQRQQKAQLEQAATQTKMEADQLENGKTKAEIQKTMADAKKTSVEAEVSAREAKVKPGSIVYDPMTGQASKID